MNCAELETLLCDYVDGALAAPGKSAQRAIVESHLETCGSCRELTADARAGASFLLRAAQIDPPEELITRLLFHAPSTSAPAQSGRRGFRGWLSAWLGPVLQPRFAMGMAMTILSFSMLGKFANLPQRQLTPADLHPVKVWSAVEDRMARTWDRAVKYYENLRLVYEIQSRLKEWSEQDENERRTQPPPSPSGARPASPNPPLEGER